MEYITLDELIEILNPKEIKNIESKTFKNVKIDSREIEKGDIFIALVGSNYDAHNFIDDVFNNGAYVAIVSKQVDYPYLLVEDTYSALKKVASFVLKKSRSTSIAVAGSSGKTTTKELISLMLKDNLSCKTAENENNFIGVSKTLLRAEKNGVCVVEVGTNHKGEIADISNFFKPDIAVFTNIGKSHIGNFGSIEAILKEKISIASKDTSIIYNYDDLYLRSAFKDKDCITCSLINPTANVYINSIDNDGLYIFSVFGEEIHLRLRNDSINIYNVLLAIAASKLYNKELSEDAINKAINEFQLPKLRMQFEKLDSTLFILDCYNANPDSMRYALSYINQKPSKKLAILGDMLELGDFSEQEHKELGRFIAAMDMDLIAYGEQAKYIYENADKGRSSFFLEKEELINYLREAYSQYSLVLIKGSRGMKMEDIFTKLKEQ